MTDNGAKCLRCGERLTPANVPDWEQPVCPKCWRDGHKCAHCKGPLPLYWDKARCPACTVQGFGLSNDPLGTDAVDPPKSLLGCTCEVERARLLDELSEAAMQGVPLPFRKRDPAVLEQAARRLSKAVTPRDGP